MEAAEGRLFFFFCEGASFFCGTFFRLLGRGLGFKWGVGFRLPFCGTFSLLGRVLGLGFLFVRLDLSGPGRVLGSGVVV